MPGGASIVTDVSGGYIIEDLYDATYTVQASKQDWSTCIVEEVVVSGGGSVTGVDMLLLPVTTVEHCSSPSLSIPDSTPAGVYDTITFADEMDISEVAVYLDITHTYIGDLIVEVTSPEGTTVRPAQQDRRFRRQHRRLVSTPIWRSTAPAPSPTSSVRTAWAIGRSG